MFFTSEFVLPFDTIREVMRAYPTWKLQFLAGNEVFIFPLALQGDPDYKEYYDRVLANPGKEKDF